MGFLWNISEDDKEIIIQDNLMQTLLMDLFILLMVVFVLAGGIGSYDLYASVAACMAGFLLLALITQVEPFFVLKDAKKRGYIIAEPLKLIVNNYDGEPNITQESSSKMFPVPTSNLKIMIQKQRLPSPAPSEAQ